MVNIRKLLHRLLEVWAGEKTVTQISEPKETRASAVPKAPPKRDIVVGFDLGTCFTKVVVRDAAFRKAYAVPFVGLSSEANPYLLPTKLSVILGGEISLVTDSSGNILEDLKDTLEGDARGRAYAAAYVALVLRHTRSWFLAVHGEDYKGVEIIWQLNFGIPSRSYDFPAKDDFIVVAKAGWRLSESDLPLTFESVMAIVSQAGEPAFEPGIHPDYINIVPEVVAEVAGYARSRRRDPGLHMLIDVGAGTLDVSTFNLGKYDGDDIYAFFSARVSKHGAAMLHRHRIRRLKERVPGADKTLEEISMLPSRIPDLTGDYIGSAGEAILQDIDAEFAQGPLKEVAASLVHTKRRKDPFSPRWKDGLPLFICGGGSRISFYRDYLISKTEHRLRNIDWRGFKPMSLPKPNELISPEMPPAEFDRLAVAYGLSYPIDDIGRIMPESEVDDFVPERRVSNLEETFVSKDMV